MKNLTLIILVSFSFLAKSAVNNLTPFFGDRNTITIDFKTGSDNLDHRDFQKNVSVTIKINGKADLFLENVNKGENWPNNSVRRIVADLPDNIIVQDIYSITVDRGNAKGMWNNVDGAGADNWNLDRLTINASIADYGGTRKFLLADLRSNRPPLYRFVYEKGRNPCTNCGYTYTHIFKHEYEPTNPSLTTTPMLAKLTFTIGTGGDNLEGGNNNVDIKIRMKDGPRVYTLRNINSSRKWDNFTENTRTIDVLNSLDMNLENIKEIEIRHTGGGGFAADNWDVDKIYIRISKDGVSKNLIDEVGAPIKRFTGDNRAFIVRF